MRYLGLITLLAVFLDCKNTGKSSSEDKNPIAISAHPGKKLLETECYICHNPKASQESMIAPPMIAVKMHYIDSNTTKAQFTDDLIAWVNNPQQESKMPGALQKFGSMPYIPYPDETLSQIAEYIYDNDIEKPQWFEAHYRQEHGKRKGKGKGQGLGKNKGQNLRKSQKTLGDKGLDYAFSTKATLGKNLIKAIEDEGTVGAIEFCNIEAGALTDSMSVMNNALIQRVSDKPRNPKNIANEEELGYIRYYKRLVASGIPPKPIVKTEEDEVHFYYPITTNSMCLQCHGQPKEQVMPATLTKLEELYPDDQALGYDVNEVRGIWSIIFDEEATN